MALTPGSRLGPYEVLAAIGAGGMGEVYRARDTKLDRDVAIKVLPASVAADTGRLARFRREARVLASLNHPNIASIYGLEEASAAPALVMELVEGESPLGPMPVEQALSLARQLAEALDYAHERGIVHRDLKPANLKVTPEGKVKVLDFGLAKAMTAAESPTESAVTIDATQQGVILGTVGYMSPEQTRGDAVDKRADIWAFGVVLYELLTGRRAFGGPSRSDSMAAVLTKEPDWSALPPGSPVELLRRCLEKDPRKRLRDVGDLDLALAPATSPATIPQPRQPIAWMVAATGLAVALAVLAAVHWWPVQPALKPLVRLDVDLGKEARLAQLGDSFGAAIISPDGERLVFTGLNPEGKTCLYTRLLEQSAAAPLSGTEGSKLPFFAPDGQWVGFIADGKLKKVSVHGGAPVTLVDVAPQARGVSWGDDGDILVAFSKGGLLRVSSNGGSLKPATELDKQKGEETHRWPQVLPGSHAVLFTLNRHGANQEDADIAVQSFNNGERKTLQKGGYYGRYLPSNIQTGALCRDCGHLVYVHEGTLFAAPMRLDRLELTGPSVPVLEDVVSTPGNGFAQFDFSRSGAFFYADSTESKAHSISWLESTEPERMGKLQPLLNVPGNQLRLSPDGKTLSFGLHESSNNIWLYEWERDRKTRLPTPGTEPVWAPDGRHLAFSSNRDGPPNIYWMRADGAGEVVRLTTSRDPQDPASFSPDGKRLIFVNQTVETSFDIWTLPLEGADTDHPTPGKPEPFLRTVADERGPVFSPDGRWVAYFSNESGRNEVYVRPFPLSSGKWQVSNGGGVAPVWSRKGGELLYQTPDSRIMAASYTIRGGNVFEANQPRPWANRQLWSPTGNGSGDHNFDVLPDGKRLVVLSTPEGVVPKPPTHITFLLNFFDELRRKAPGKN